MISLELSPQSTRARSARRGSLVVEAVISAALLGTAAYALTRLARTSAVLSQQADQQLAATLTAENLVERLRRVETGDLSQQATTIAQSLADTSQCEIGVFTESFTNADRQGIHLRIDVTSSPQNRVTLHDWRLVDSSDLVDPSDGEDDNGSVNVEGDEDSSGETGEGDDE